ncbi:MAG: ATP-binding protein [Planctomycetota bacterium]|nr:ATP-binding protein [Planctomycetota bacterium]
MTTLLLLDQAARPTPSPTFQETDWRIERVETVDAARERMAAGDVDMLLVGVDSGRHDQVLIASLRKAFPTQLIVLIATENERRGMSLTFQLPPDRARVPQVVGYLRDCAAEFGFSGDDEAFELAVAIDEALTNALIHGTLEVDGRLRGLDPSAHNALVERRITEEPYRSRRIHVEASIEPDMLRFVVRDEGPGFDATSIEDPTDPVNALRPHGRGVMLMRAFMDEVEFNETGNEITLVKRRA